MNVLDKNKWFLIGEIGTAIVALGLINTGAIAQWKAITKGIKWHFNVPATVVHCTDGDASI